MRCPECNLRNSVASRSCTSCGHRFKKKPVSKELKIGIAALAGVGLIWAASAAIIPQFTDPQQNLTRISKRMLAGPGNANEAKSMRKEFEQAISAYLEKIGGSSSNELTNKLQKLLPSEAFEVHVVELPRGLKVVEVDTMLEASSFLVMKGDRQTKIFPLNGLEVFDDARLLNETAGPLLVLLGHTGGQVAHQPQVRAYALMPDTIADVTDKFIPKVVGEGTARFAKNNRDIQLDLCVLSMGKADNVISKDTKVQTTTAHQNLQWKDAHYVSVVDYVSSPLVPLYAAAECLRNPELVNTYKQYLGPKGQELVAHFKSPNAGNFVIKKGALGRGQITYVLTGTNGAFKVDVSRDKNNNWTIASYSTAKKDAANAIANSNNDEESITEEPEEKPAALAKIAEPAPVVIVKKNEPAPIVVQKRKEKLPVKTIAAIKPEPKLVPQIKPREISKKPAERVEHIAVGQTAAISSNISASTVNIRTSPSTDAKPLAEVSKGSPIEIVGKEGGWYKVRHNGKLGYVYGGLVEYTRPDAYTTATITKGTTALDQKKKATVKPQAGDRVIVLGGMKNDKYRVQFPNGKTGYVNKDAVNVNIDTPQFVP